MPDLVRALRYGPRFRPSLMRSAIVVELAAATPPCESARSIKAVLSHGTALRSGPPAIGVDHGRSPRRHHLCTLTSRFGVHDNSPTGPLGAETSVAGHSSADPLPVACPAGFGRHRSPHPTGRLCSSGFCRRNRGVLRRQGQFVNETLEGKALGAFWDDAKGRYYGQIGDFNSSKVGPLILSRSFSAGIRDSHNPRAMEPPFLTARIEYL